jgi:flagellar biosynthesis chaperone FliJ
MGVPKGLERLLHIRGVEEEQRRRSLESALAQLKALEHARHAALQMDKRGRARVSASVVSGAIADRQAGQFESEMGRRRARMLAARIADTEKEAVARHQEFLEKRIERRQAETLVEEAQAREDLESGRRSQRSIDDWYGARRRRRGDGEQG